MGEEQNVLEIKELKSYFYTEKGVAKAVDGVNITIPKGKSSDLSEKAAAERA